MNKKWHLRRIPAVFTPAHIKATRDLSQFYEKPPSEMSRYELQELEKMLVMTEEEKEFDASKIEPEYDEFGNQIDPLLLFKETEEYSQI